MLKSGRGKLMRFHPAWRRPRPCDWRRIFGWPSQAVRLPRTVAPNHSRIQRPHWH